VTTSGWTILAHVLIALAIIGALCAMAVEGSIPGSDAFTGIMAIAVGAGVVAGANLTPSAPASTTTTVTKEPA
jgi:hypothetical protein